MPRPPGFLKKADGKFVFGSRIPLNADLTDKNGHSILIKSSFKKFTLHVENKTLEQIHI